MTYRLLQLPPDTYDFVQSSIESGRYESSGELVKAAFRALHRQESESSGKLMASSIPKDDAFRKLWETSPLLPADRRKAERLD